MYSGTADGIALRKQWKKWLLLIQNIFRRMAQGLALYVRPLIYGAGARVGLGPASEYVFIVFVTPVGPYYKESGFKPVKALVVEQFDRAAPNGVGDCKVGRKLCCWFAWG